MGKNLSWKQTITNVSTQVIQKHRMPMIAKEVAWRALRFASRCRNSHPLSFALRPLFSHKRLHLVIGIIMILGLSGVAFAAPLASTASSDNTGGGPIAMSVLPEGEVNPATRESVKVPVKYNYISQGYWAWHPGVDLAGHVGEPINPVMDGVVSQVLYDKWDFGKHIIITHANKYSSLYAHMSKINVVVGQNVTTNTTIGELGSTGRSTGPHLHLEIRDEADRPTNPATFLGIK